MIRAIEIEWPEGLADGAEALLAPRPFGHWGESLHRFEAEGVSSVSEIGAENSGCRGYLLRLAPGARPRLRYEV
ncbi:MAG: hypothetical protein AAFW46_01585, partial [Pseudomonadota bacterium]